MRNLNSVALSGSATSAVNSPKVDAGQLYVASFIATFTDSASAGAFKVQASNDICAYGNISQDFTPTNWVDIPSATATVTAGAAAVIRISDLCFRWIRVVWTPTAGGGNISALINAQGF